jgi:hypothetical protein
MEPMKVLGHTRGCVTVRPAGTGFSRGIGAALIMASTNTEAMNEHLKEVSVQVATGAHAALLCDGAG